MSAGHSSTVFLEHGLHPGVTESLRGPSPISPPPVKYADLLRPVVESRRRATASHDHRIIAFPFSAVFVSSAGSHPEAGTGPNTY